MTVAPPVVIPALMERLREDLHSTGFTVDGLEAYLGEVASAALRRDEFVPAELRTRRDDSHLAAVVRLFTIGVEVDFDVVDAAFPTLGGDGLVALGLARRVGAALVAGVDLQPYGAKEHPWWVASDLTKAPGAGPLETSHVLGVGGASTTLANWTPRPEVERALDLGTGGGVQALHLDGHAGHVVATDVSERALQFAAFNAALAGVSWELRRGSLFEPVAGETFDLVVSNPPYVITPRARGVPLFDYRDGGAFGDDIMRSLVGRVGDHLTPGGLAQLIGNWEIPAGAEWTARPRDWLAGTGLDAWIIQRDVQDPAEYASTWARDGGHVPGSFVFEELYTAWLDDFAARGVQEVGFGIMTLQKPRSQREPFVDLMEVLGGVSLPMGEVVAEGMRTRTWLAEHGDAELLEQRLVAAGDVTIERHQLPGHAAPAAIVIRQGGGLRRALRVGPHVSAVVDVADGELTLHQALVAIAAVMDEPADEVMASVLPVVRDLLAGGFLRRG